MMKHLLVATGCLLAGAAQAQSLTLEGVPPGEVVQSAYRCEGDRASFKLPPGEVHVAYYNAGENHLAVLPFADGPRVFVNVIAGSGARYVSGALEWWEKGGEARLSSVQLSGQQVTCRAVR
jgi:membrane-bound inhibitor of C-type lysozyme